MPFTNPSLLAAELNAGARRRIAVVGLTGSGKTTLAGELARRLGLEHIEMDALHWLPGWKKPPAEEFRARLAEHLAQAAGGWAIDGNYSDVRPLVWGQAQALVWLDFPIPLVWGRIIRRTLGRIVRRELLWGTNREGLDAFFSKDSLLLYAVQSQPRMRRNYPAALVQPQYAHLAAVRLRNPKEVGKFMEKVEDLKTEYLKR